MEPYKRTAFIYDRLIGEAAFSNWLKNFSRLRERFNITFDFCADIACGTGLVAEYLAREGALVYAVDKSEEMLKVARERAQDLPIVFLQQDLLELDLPGEVDLITCNTDSLNYILEEERLAVAFSNFYKVLKNKGSAIFDMNTLYQLRGGADIDAWEFGDEGVIFSWRSDFDESKGIATLEMSNYFLEDGSYRLYREVHKERGYEQDLLMEILIGAGFRKIYAWDFAGLAPINPYTRRIQFLATK